MYNTIKMDHASLATQLSGLPLGPLRYFDQIASTNNEAAGWADAGAPDGSLVVADEQTAGRGRQGRSWFTPPGAALAFSLVLRPQEWPGFAVLHAGAPQLVAHLTALGALAVCQALEMLYQLPAEIKWPNDVLLARHKTAGVLAEAHWHGDRLAAVILGIGINIAPPSVPPAGELVFPATCVQAALGRPLERLDLLRAVLESLLAWKDRLGAAEFLQAWDQRLAFKNEWVTILEETPAGQQTTHQGRLVGLDEQGWLVLSGPDGYQWRINSGEVHLRPAAYHLPDR